jgi:hypothetical protein
MYGIPIVRTRPTDATRPCDIPAARVRNRLDGASAVYDPPKVPRNVLNTAQIMVTAITKVFSSRVLPRVPMRPMIPQQMQSTMAPIRTRRLRPNFSMIRVVTHCVAKVDPTLDERKHSEPGQRLLTDQDLYQITVAKTGKGKEICEMSC